MTIMVGKKHDSRQVDVVFGAGDESSHQTRGKRQKELTRSGVDFLKFQSLLLMTHLPHQDHTS